MTTATDSIDVTAAARLRAGRSVDQNALAPRVAPRLRAERVDRLERVVAERVRRRTHETNERIATLNHELRTPLSLVIGYTEMLLGGVAGAVNEQQQEMLHHVEAGGARLNDLVQELLRISIESAERTDVVNVGAEVLKMLGATDASGHPQTAATQGDLPTLGR